jgi:hypothetical protein
MCLVKIAALVLSVLLLAAPAFAADVDGKWSGSIDTPNGPVNVFFDFKADGAMLTGTTVGPDNAPVPIKNGKIEGSNISFSVSLDFGGMPVEINYKGVVAPAEIKITGDFMGQTFQLSVKKAS